MTPGKRILDALAEQGFAPMHIGDDYVIRIRDGRVLHQIPAEVFDQHDPVNTASLRRVVAGLEILEGFTPPQGFWD